MQHWRLAASARPQCQRWTHVGFIHGAPNWHMCSLTCCAHGRLHNWTSSGNIQRRLVSGFSKPTGICSSTHSLMTEIVNCAMALPCSTALCSLGDNPGRPHRSTSDLRALGMPLPPRPRRARDHDEQSVPSQTPHTFLARRAAMSTACNWASQRSNPSLMSSPRLVSPAAPTAAQRPATPQKSSRQKLGARWRRASIRAAISLAN